MYRDTRITPDRIIVGDQMFGSDENHHKKTYIRVAGTMRERVAMPINVVPMGSQIRSLELVWGDQAKIRRIDCHGQTSQGQDTRGCEAIYWIGARVYQIFDPIQAQLFVSWQARNRQNITSPIDWNDDSPIHLHRSI